MTNANLRSELSGVLPLLAVLVIIGVGLLLVGWIVIALTTKTLVTVVLLGLGVYLLVKPQTLSGFGKQTRVIIPFALIIIAILFYSGVFSGWM